MQKILLILIFIIPSFNKCEVKHIDSNDKQFKRSIKYLVNFAKTNSGHYNGPDISKFSNKKLFAKLEEGKNFLRWFTFQNKDDVADLQRGCYRRSYSTIEWYYLNK